MGGTMPAMVWWGRNVGGRALHGAAILLVGFVILAAAGAGDVLAACGDGVLDPGEQCDNGAGNGTAGQCCDWDCAFSFIGTVCRFASAETCDVEEYCSGSSATCPADAGGNVGTICRASAGPCDQAEICNGAVNCPSDVFAPPSTVCRAKAFDCDQADNCTGSAVTCPFDEVAPDGQLCTSDGSFCTGVETCVAGVCTSNPPVCDDGNPCTND